MVEEESLDASELQVQKVECLDLSLVPIQATLFL
jgi:hypothetical protein